jgi:hypothetical protein
MDQKTEPISEARERAAPDADFWRFRPAARRWPAGDVAAAIILFLIGLATNVATVLNNAYSTGSTLYDSTIFQTIIWRSGWALKPAPVISDSSFLNIHFSPIQYLPDAISYLMPLDRMSYYGLVYGTVYGLLLVAAFVAFRPLSGGRTVVAALGAFLFYLSGPVNAGQWEPHEEIASALFMVGFFLAWTQRRWRLAAVLLVLNAGVREDCGVLLALPLLLLALWERWTRPRAGQRPPDSHALPYAIASVALSIAFWIVKRVYFNGFDTVAAFYYGTPPFAHLSQSLIAGRAAFILFHGQYLWVPGIVLLAAAWRCREPRLAIGWLAYLPFLLFNFFSKLELNAQLGSYKSFPLILTMLWPAIVALLSDRAARRRLAWVQGLVLLAALVSFEYGGLRLAPPTGLGGLIARWSLQPETEHAALYRMFEARLADSGLGTVRASQAALALYPYSFPRWERSLLTAAPDAEAAQVDSLFWFAGDRDEAATRRWLQRGHFPYFYQVIGTRLFIATRKPPATLATLSGAIRAIPPPPDATP